MVALLASTVCYAKLDLALTNKLHVEVENPLSVALAGEGLVFVYSNGAISVKRVNPKNVYDAVDLTGMLQLFVKAVFDVSQRRQLPAQWMDELAKQQAKAYGIKKDNWRHQRIGEADLYMVFDAEGKTGNVFVLENGLTYQIQITGDKGRYSSFVESIRIEKNGAE